MVMVSTGMSVRSNMAIRARQPDIKVSFFSDEDVENMLAYVDERIHADSKRRGYHKRYQLLLKTLLRTGARISEALMLKPSDINLQTGTITIVTLKKDPRKNPADLKPYAARKLPKRTLPLHPDLKDAMMQYFLEMHVDVRSDALLFPITRGSVDNYLTKMEKSLGIKVNAHKFRHTFAVRSLIDGVPVNVLQKWLAHSSLMVTSVYADVLSMDTSQFMRQIH